MLSEYNSRRYTNKFFLTNFLNKKCAFITVIRVFTEIMWRIDLKATGHDEFRMMG